MSSTVIGNGDLKIYMLCQHAKKVMSNSLGLVDFAIGLVNSVLNFSAQLPNSYCNQCCSSKIFWGYLKDSWASTY